MAEAPLRLGWLGATYSVLTVLSSSPGVDANTLDAEMVNMAVILDYYTSVVASHQRVLPWTRLFPG